MSTVGHGFKKGTSFYACIYNVTSLFAHQGHCFWLGKTLAWFGAEDFVFVVSVRERCQAVVVVLTKRWEVMLRLSEGIGVLFLVFLLFARLQYTSWRIPRPVQIIEVNIGPSYHRSKTHLQDQNFLSGGLSFSGMKHPKYCK